MFHEVEDFVEFGSLSCDEGMCFVQFGVHGTCLRLCGDLHVLLHHCHMVRDLRNLHLDASLAFIEFIPRFGVAGLSVTPNLLRVLP